MKILKKINPFFIILVLALIVVNCNNYDTKDETDQSQAPTEVMAETKLMLEEGLTLMFKDSIEFKPECDKEYPINVYNRMLVYDCDSINKIEIRDMAKSLIKKAKTGANKICQLNPQCPTAKLVRFKIRRNVCNNRVWEVDVKFFFICI